MDRTFQTSDGAHLVYSVTGEGSPLLLLPGWSQSAAMFRNQIDTFSKSHRVIALDFRGHGQSADADHGYRVSRFARDVHELLDHEEIASLSALGWSMGASVLWSYIDLFGTARLRSLIFVDEPAAVMHQPGMDDEAVADAGAIFDATSLGAIAAQIVGADGASVREAFVGSMVTKAIDPALHRWIVAENLRVTPQAAASLLIDHASLDWRDIFRRIDRPVLVFGGMVSHVSVRSQRWIASQIADVELVITNAEDGGAHFMFLERPEPFNAAVARFLSRRD
ncbi:hydrolase signal peptide protein [Mesorhizobium sp. 113-1-2]|uniref:alpha/beta fold hydrolase n=1 Tax=Mesorhizobium sp. 113-1-2 TaxID=2744515 RepID=UPI0019272420|nr:alpha/beta hydrolase [Mesorhizobium sp. 113-1-2]BCG72801.1 hydrolase signal peptide protein [Mesorhizobium sp. 113-1-2]